jgi:uncharacterized protein
VSTSRIIAIVAALATHSAACQKSSTQTPSPSSPVTELGSSASQHNGNDPWAPKPPRADDPPSMADNQKAAQLACPRVTKPPFFRIEKNGKVSHILGSRHIGIGFSKQPAVVDKTLRSASKVIFEVAPGDDADSAEHDGSVSKALGPQLWQKYRTLVGPSQADAIEQRGTAVAALTMMIEFEDITQTLDQEIQNLAKELGKDTGGLETAEFQDKLLNNLLDDRALRATVAGTKDREEMKQHSSKDIAEYCTGVDKEPGLDAEDRQDMRDAGYSDAEIAQQEEVLLFARNAAWIPQLETLFTSNGVFVVVGADHLRGERGVIEMLKKRGFAITRVLQ